MPTHKTPKDRVRQPVIEPGETWLVVYPVNGGEADLTKVIIPAQECDNMSRARRWVCGFLGLPAELAPILEMEPVR